MLTKYKNTFGKKMAQVQSRIKYSISPRWAIALKGVASRCITSENMITGTVAIKTPSYFARFYYIN